MAVSPVSTSATSALSLGPTETLLSPHRPVAGKCTRTGLAGACWEHLASTCNRHRVAHGMGASWGICLGCLSPASKNLPSSEAGPAQTGPTPWTRPVTHMRRVPALGWAHSYFKAPLLGPQARPVQSRGLRDALGDPLPPDKDREL